jgi:hypothetical protein
MTKNKVVQSGQVTPGHLVQWVTDGVVKDSQSPPIGFPSLSASFQFSLLRNGNFSVPTSAWGVYQKNPVDNAAQGTITGGIEVSMPSTDPVSPGILWPAGVYGVVWGSPPVGTNVGSIHGGDFDGIFEGPGSCTQLTAVTAFTQVDGGSVQGITVLDVVGCSFNGGTLTGNISGIHIRNMPRVGVKQFGIFIDNIGAAGSFGWVTSGADVNWSGGSVVVSGDISPIAANATTGFLYIPTTQGPPSGVPIFEGSTIPMVYDPNTNKMWVYNGGWKSAQFA